MSAGRARTPCRAGAARARGRRAACRGGAAGPVRRVDAHEPQRVPAGRIARDGVADERPGRGGEQDLARAGAARELACRLQGRTCDHRSGDHDTGSDSCPYGEGVVDRGQRGARLVSRADCAEGVILMERRDAEHCQHVGSRRLLDGASVALDSPPHGGCRALLERAQHLRIAAGGRLDRHQCGRHALAHVPGRCRRPPESPRAVRAGRYRARRLGVLEQDPLMETLQLLARLDPELVDEQSPRLLIDLERVRLAAAAVQREHQHRPHSLAQWLLARKRLELRDDCLVQTSLELGLDPPLVERVSRSSSSRAISTCANASFSMPANGRPRQSESAERRSSARSSAGAAWDLRTSSSTRSRSSLPGREAEEIARTRGLDPLRSQQPPQRGHLVLQRSSRGRRRPLSPQRVDQPVGRPTRSLACSTKKASRPCVASRHAATTTRPSTTTWSGPRIRKLHGPSRRTLPARSSAFQTSATAGHRILEAPTQSAPDDVLEAALTTCANGDLPVRRFPGGRTTRIDAPSRS